MKKRKTPLIYDEFKEYETTTKERKLCVKELKMFGDSYSYEFRFENGYGASVIKHIGSFGYKQDLFELAVIKRYDNDDYYLCYDTPITDDVLGYLTNDDVLKLLERIKKLEKK